MREIKEKLGFVARTANLDANLADKEEYMLPDGEVITIGVERCLAPECLFNPSAVGKKLYPLDDVICTAIKHCDVDLRPDMYSNIMLTGGSSLFPGLRRRLAKEGHFLKNTFM